MGLNNRQKQKTSSPSGPKLIRVKVIPRSKNPGVSQQDDGLIVVRVKSPPHQGQANKEMLARLASHLQQPRSHLQIKQGHNSRIKMIAVKGLSGSKGNRHRG